MKAYDGGRLYYKVSVEDNGPGIPDEIKPILFTRSLRGTHKVKGSGIGLYLVKTLVKATMATCGPKTAFRATGIKAAGSWSCCRASEHQGFKALASIFSRLRVS